MSSNITMKFSSWCRPLINYHVFLLLTINFETEKGRVQFACFSDLYIWTERGNSFHFFFQGSTFQWCNDIGKDPEKILPNASSQSYFNTDYQVPAKDPDIDPKLHHIDNKNETPAQNIVVANASQIFPKVAPHEFCSQHRDIAITRYKEKRKSRR